MKRSLSLFSLLAVATSAFLFSNLSALDAMSQAKEAGKRSPVLKTPAEMKWKEVPDVHGAQQAVLWGDPQKGASGLLTKFKAGTEVALHSHTSDLRSVVISGTLIITLEGQAPKELGPGSYGFEPGGSKHTTACKAGADCMIFTQAPRPFDVVMATSGGK